MTTGDMSSEEKASNSASPALELPDGNSSNSSCISEPHRIFGVGSMDMEEWGFGSGKQSSSLTNMNASDDATGGGFFGQSVSDMSKSSECPYCSKTFTEPRVLFCLHTFCDGCIRKMLNSPESQPASELEKMENMLGKLSGELQPSAKALEKILPGNVVCPVCKQASHIGVNGDVSSILLPDFLQVAEQEATAMDKGLIVCTSCKAAEKAVARCTDCAQFLCQNCVEAHQYMRCFEGHKVLSFEDMKSTGAPLTVHKPVFCNTHITEQVRYFCCTCETPVCNECMMGNHKPPEHRYEKVDDEMENKNREEISKIVQQSKAKAEKCEAAAGDLEKELGSIQSQVDSVKHTIDVAFTKYHEILDRAKENLVDQLDELHSTEERDVNENIKQLNSTVQRISDACKFATKLLDDGQRMEFLSFKKLIRSQLLTLINNTPLPHMPQPITFVHDQNQFEHMVKIHAGCFKKEAASVQSQDMSSFSGGVLGASTFGATMGTSSVVGAGIFGRGSSMQPSAPEFVPRASSIPPSGFTSSSTATDILSGRQSAVTTTVNANMNDNLTNLAEIFMHTTTPAPQPTGLMADEKLFAAATDFLKAQGQLGLQINPTLSGGIGNLSGGRNTSPLGASKGFGTNPSQTQQNAIMPSNRYLVENAANSIAEAASMSSALINGGGSGGSGGTGAPGHSMPPMRTPTPIGSMQSYNPAVSSGSMNVPPPSMMPPPSAGFSSASAMPALGPPPGSNYTGPMPSLNPPVRQGKMNPMSIKAKFGSLGPSKCQFNSPHGFCLGPEEEIVVADTNNHRIQIFSIDGDFKYQFGIPGKEEGQLWYPRKVAVMNPEGKFIVCDRGNERSRMQFFTRNGHFLIKIAIRYIDIVAGLAITPDGMVVAVDSVSPTVFCIRQNGELHRWFDCSEYMREPSDVAVSGSEYYVCDFKGHCVVVFTEEGQFLRRIGCENVTNFPNGIDISDAGDILVGDSHGNRFHVAVFEKSGGLLSEFECPYVKVSRCCGLKITSSGYIITLAKNNHHMLVLDTIYVAPVMPAPPL